MRVIALQGNLIGRSEKAGPQGAGWNEELSFTLNSTDRHAIVFVENVEESMHQTSLWEEALASHSASQDSEKDWMTLAATSHLHTLQLLISIAPNGSFGKMSPVSCHPTEEGTLAASSGRWMKSGMGMRGVCWTLNMSEHPTIRGLSLNDEGVSSLSEILETQAVPQRFYLTPKACLGILRRAEQKGKELPPMLKQALEATASGGTEQTELPR